MPETPTVETVKAELLEEYPDVPEHEAGKVRLALEDVEREMHSITDRVSEVFGIAERLGEALVGMDYDHGLRGAIAPHEPASGFCNEVYQRLEVVREVLSGEHGQLVELRTFLADLDMRIFGTPSASEETEAVPLAEAQLGQRG